MVNELRVKDIRTAGHDHPPLSINH